MKKKIILTQHEKKIEMKTDRGKNNEKKTLQPFELGPLKTLDKQNQILNRRHRI